MKALAMIILSTLSSAFALAQLQTTYVQPNQVKPLEAVMIKYKRFKCETLNEQGFRYFDYQKFQEYKTSQVFVNLLNDQEGKHVAFTISRKSDWDLFNSLSMINNYSRYDLYKRQLNEIRQYNKNLESQYTKKIMEINLKNEELAKKGEPATIAVPFPPNYIKEPILPVMMSSRYVVKKDQYGQDLTGMEIKFGDLSLARTECVPTPHKLSHTKDVSADGAAYQSGKKATHGAQITQLVDYMWCDSRTMEGNLTIDDSVLRAITYKVRCDFVNEGLVEQDVFLPAFKTDFNF